MGPVTQALLLMLVLVAAQGIHSDERIEDTGGLVDVAPDGYANIVNEEDEEEEHYRSKRWGIRPFPRRTKIWPVRKPSYRIRPFWPTKKRKPLWGDKVRTIWRSRIGHRGSCKRCDIGRDEEVYEQCGRIKCVEDSICNSAHSKCTCPLGEVGHARVDCASPDTCCLCTIIGDPHFTNYFGANFRLPLPCGHKIADLTIPSYHRTCKVLVVGLGWFNHSHSPSMADFEKTIHVKVSFDDIVFTVAFVGSNPPATELLQSSAVQDVSDYESLGVFVDSTPDDAGFYVIRVKPCHVRVKYRPERCSFSLLTPARSKDRCGMCGECSERWINATGPEAPDLLKMTMDNLFPFSPIDDTDINTYPCCTELYHIHRGCPIERRKFAQDFCGLMLEDHNIKACMAAQVGDSGILEKYKTCYEDVCKKSQQICSHVDFFADCLPDSDVAVFKAMTGFCPH